MDTLTTSALDIARLRKLIQRVLLLPDGAVVGSGLPENSHPAFITIDELFSQEIGQSKREFNGQAEIITTSSLTTVSFSCYGKNAYQMALKIRTLLQSSALISAMRPLKASFVSFSAVRNLTATVGADYEERGQFDAVISHHHTISVPLAPIEQVDIHTQPIEHQIITHIRKN